MAPGGHSHRVAPALFDARERRLCRRGPAALGGASVIGLLLCGVVIGFFARLILGA